MARKSNSIQMKRFHFLKVVYNLLANQRLIQYANPESLSGAKFVFQYSAEDAFQFNPLLGLFAGG